MAYQKGINVNVLAESGQTDEETIEIYEEKYPYINLSLAGKEELNEALFEISHQENLSAIKSKALREGHNEADATKISEQKAGILLKNALNSYEKLKKQRASRAT